MKKLFVCMLIGAGLCASPAYADGYNPFLPLGGIDPTVVFPKAFSDKSDATAEQIAQMADSSVQQTDANQANGYPLIGTDLLTTIGTKGPVQAAQLNNAPTLYHTTDVSLCQGGGTVPGDGYSVGMRIRLQDGSIATVATLRTYTYTNSAGQSVTTSSGIGSLTLTNGAYNTTNMSGSQAWSDWSKMIDAPWLASSAQIVKVYACMRVNATQAVNNNLNATLLSVHNLDNGRFDPKAAGVLFDGSAADAANIQKYHDMYRPHTIKVNGQWPDNFVLDKTNNPDNVLIDATSVFGTTMYGAGKSEGDTYASYYNGILDLSRTDNVSPNPFNPVFQIRRYLGTPNETGYYASGEFQSTPFEVLNGVDNATTGQFTGYNVDFLSTQSKGFPSQNTMYQGHHIFSGKAGHWAGNFALSDITHEPAKAGTWEITNSEIDHSGSGTDDTRSLFNPVKYSGRMGDVLNVHSESTNGWAANKSYTAKYDFYGASCEKPGTGVCMMYNPEHSDHVQGFVKTTTTYNFTGETTVSGTSILSLNEYVQIDPDFDTLTISGDGIPSQTAKSWTYNGIGTAISLATPMTASSASAAVTLTVTHNIPYIFRAVAPNGGDLTDTKADYVATSASTMPNWAAHLDGTVFPEQTDSSGNAVSGTVWWQLATIDKFGIGAYYVAPRNARQFYSSLMATSAIFKNAPIDISGAMFDNYDGKAAQIRLNDRVPALDFTGCLDTDETITGWGTAGNGAEGCKNNHTMGYDPNLKAVSYKVKGSDKFHVDDQGSASLAMGISLGRFTTAQLLTLSGYPEGYELWDTDLNAPVYYHSGKWYQGQLGAALSN